MLKTLKLLLLLCIVTLEIKAQDTSSYKYHNGLTPAQKLIANSGEDLLTGGNAQSKQTVISGYGDISYKHDFKYKNSTWNVNRVVLFVGHQFSKKIAFFSELEIEDAKVEGGGFKGSVGMEQAYLKFSFNPRHYLVAGLFLPRIGILNENHLPINFNGVERPLVEQAVIPGTWREIGIGYYGQAGTFPLTYSAALMSGLNSADFVHGTGFKSGRSEGQLATGDNIAVTASAKVFTGDFQWQVSGYVGGTTGIGAYQADSLHLQSGPFGTPLYLGEADMQYNKGGFGAKALYVYVSYPRAGDVNSAYANNTFKTMYGAYAELSYDLLYNKVKTSEKQLIAFGRLEKMNLNESIPSSGIIDPALDQWHVVTGLNYFPLANLVIKADVRFTHTGPQNENLILNPPPVMQPYQQNNQFLNIGIGYAF